MIRPIRCEDPGPGASTINFLHHQQNLNEKIDPSSPGQIAQVGNSVMSPAAGTYSHVQNREVKDLAVRTRRARKSIDNPHIEAARQIMTNVDPMSPKGPSRPDQFQNQFIKNASLVDYSAINPPVVRMSDHYNYGMNVQKFKSQQDVVNNSQNNPNRQHQYQQIGKQFDPNDMNVNRGQSYSELMKIANAPNNNVPNSPSVNAPITPIRQRNYDYQTYNTQPQAPTQMGSPMTYQAMHPIQPSAHPKASIDQVPKQSAKWGAEATSFFNNQNSQMHTLSPRNSYQAAVTPSQQIPQQQQSYSVVPIHQQTNHFRENILLAQNHKVAPHLQITPQDGLLVSNLHQFDQRPLQKEMHKPKGTMQTEPGNFLPKMVEVNPQEKLPQTNPSVRHHLFSQRRSLPLQEPIETSQKQVYRDIGGSIAQQKQTVIDAYNKEQFDGRLGNLSYPPQFYQPTQ